MHHVNAPICAHVSKLPQTLTIAPISAVILFKYYIYLLLTGPMCMTNRFSMMSSQDMIPISP